MQACLVSARDLFAFSGEVVFFVFWLSMCKVSMWRELYHFSFIWELQYPQVPRKHDSGLKVHHNYLVTHNFQNVAFHGLRWASFVNNPNGETGEKIASRKDKTRTKWELKPGLKCASPGFGALCWILTPWIVKERNELPNFLCHW